MERTLNYISQDNNITLEDFLIKKYDYSKRLIVILKQLETGLTVNNKRVNSNYILKPNDKITINIPMGENNILPIKLPLEIIYKDDDFIAVNKPANMPVHPSKLHQNDTLMNGISYILKKMNIEANIHIINRLDTDTTGVVLIGLNPYATAQVSKSIKKTYYAIVNGIINSCGSINKPIKRIDNISIKRVVSDDGEYAVTNYEPLKIKNDKTLLKINLETGRTHQIRVHFSSIGMPLVGDKLYGDTTDIMSRQALHCGKIEFLHPITKNNIVISTNLPNDMSQIINF